MVEKDSRELMVTIRCLVYNHEPFLRQCLDGFVMQQTNFRFEAIVHDDASTDGSAAIIREYAAKYPDIIKPIYETENQYSKRDGSLRRIMNAHMHGKYVAYCEGDDYWTDPLKLQKQVDFLESHPDYVMCSHRFKIYNQSKQQMGDDWHDDVTAPFSYNLNSLIHDNWYHTPATVVYRYSAFCMEEYEKYKNAKDATLYFYLLKKGNGYMMPEQMAVYREHSGGVWSGVPYYNRLHADFINRMSIYEVEQSDEAACFLRSLFTRLMSRKWMLQEWKLMLKSFRIISKHFGVLSTSRQFLSKFFLNKNLAY